MNFTTTGRGNFSDSYLRTWKKKDLIDYIRCLEHNCDAAHQQIEQQIKNFEKILDDRRKKAFWELIESYTDVNLDVHKDRCRCTYCGFVHEFIDYHFGQYNYCPGCGAVMDEVKENGK